MEIARSFTASRTAASNLPTFQLPPPDHQMHKYPTFRPSSTTQPTPAVVSSVLTPPASVSSDGLSPLASSVNIGSLGGSAAGVPPYQPTSIWPTSPTLYSTQPMPASYAQQQQSLIRPHSLDVPRLTTPSGKANLERIRDNQRRSRARRKEYLQELEARLRQYELQGIEASSEIHTASRRVADENKKLRGLLVQHGVGDDTINSYLQTSPATDTIIHGQYGSSSAEVQMLEQLLEPRKAFTVQRKTVNSTMGGVQGSQTSSASLSTDALKRYCWNDEATSRNDGKSGSESPFGKRVRILDSVDSDDQEEKAPKKADKDLLTNSQEPKQIQEDPRSSSPVIMPNAMKIDSGLRMRSIEHKECLILEKIGSEVRLVLTSNPILRVTDFGKVHMQSTFRVWWNPRDFMRRQFGDSRLASIGSVIALSGTSLNAQATTCKEYLQTHWPTTCLTMLKCLEDCMDGLRNISRGDDLELYTWMDGEHQIFEVEGKGEKIVEIAQQLAWLGAALQHSLDGGLKTSEAKISAVQGWKSVFDITFSLSPLNKNQSSCWHSLFTSSVIAKGFPIAERGHEAGLEIPLEMMAALTGVRHAVEYEGGILLKGHSGAFLPVKRYKDSIQWHYMENDENVRLPYWKVEALFPGRAMLDEVSMDSLKKTRAFVGWWGTTETHLGTETAKYENIDWSASGQVGRPMRISGATMGFQQILTGEVNFSLGARDGKLHVERKGPYQRIVQCAARSPVVLYDYCEKRAWLVPSSAVILHIAKTRHYRNPYMNDGKKITFPSADPSTNSHEAAEKVLLEQAPFKLCTEGDRGDENYYLRDLVRDIWSYLESLIDKNVKKEATSDPEVRETMRDILRGWEFMDLVDDRSPFRLKETYIEKSSGGWTNLARDIDAVVLFGSGFEDIIKPNEESMAGLCHMWKSVPKGKDYLTASVPIMNQLYQQAGSKLSRKHLTSTHLRWHRGGQLWERCEPTTPFSCSCNRLQQIVSNYSTHFRSISDPGLLEEKGAVIFGQASDPLVSTVLELLKPKVKQGGSLYSQPNVEFLSTDTFSSPDSNLSSDAGTSVLSVSVSTLPTSDEDDQDPKVEVVLEPLGSRTVKLTGNDQKRKPSRSLKRSHSREDARSTHQPYRRQRKRCTLQTSEVEVQCKVAAHTPALLNTHCGGSVASLIEKTTGEAKKLSLRRKGNFTKRNETSDSVHRGGNMALRNG